MPRMKAIQAAVQILQREGVRHAFGVPGAAINPFYAAMRESGAITHVLARHVEGASHMAEGYTRTAAGNIGVCVGTSGPAGTDMLTGLYSAAADSIPILCITGQAPVARLHKEDFQAVDIAAIAKPVTKLAMTVLESAQVPGAFQQAFHLMRSGRPGPGPARPALRRAAGRDRLRHRRLRAAARPPAGGDPDPGREGAGHARGGRAATDRGRRRDRQRRRRRPAGGVRRAGRGPGRPHPDGLGDDPRRPPADGRHGRAPDQPALRQRHPARLRPRARHRQPLGQPPHRRSRGLPARAPLRPCRHRAHPDRPGLPSRPRHRLRRRPGPPAVRRGRPGAPGGRAAARPRRLGRGVRRAQADHAAAYPLRRRPGQAPAGVRGDDQGLRQGGPLRQHHRPVPDRRRPVPARLPAASLDQRRPGRPAGLDAARGPRGLRGRPRGDRGRPCRATTTSSS